MSASNNRAGVVSVKKEYPEPRDMKLQDGKHFSFGYNSIICGAFSRTCGVCE